MYCYRQSDYPLRMSPKNSNIVHAVTRMYRNNITACKHYPSFQDGWWYRKKGTCITCQNCQRALGFVEKELSDIRHVIYDSSTGLYLRYGEKSKWVEHPYAATRWHDQDAPKRIVEDIMLWHRRGGRNTLEIRKARLKLEFER